MTACIFDIIDNIKKKETKMKHYMLILFCLIASFSGFCDDIDQLFSLFGKDCECHTAITNVCTACTNMVYKEIK